MLSTIADQEHPGIIFARMFHEPQHLRYAQHRCLVNYKPVRAFRPELESLKRSRLETFYHMVAQELEVPPSACCMIATHMWDTIGAQSAVSPLASLLGLATCRSGYLAYHSRTLSRRICRP